MKYLKEEVLIETIFMSKNCTLKLEITQNLSLKSNIPTYIDQGIKQDISDSIKYSLLADITKIFATGDPYEFWQLSLKLDKGRTTEELFVDTDRGYVASILFFIDWIKKYSTDEKRSIKALNSMIVSLINIGNHAALDFLGITDEKRNQIVKEGEELSDSFYSE